MSWAYLHKASTLLSPSPFPHTQLRGPWGPSEGLWAINCGWRGSWDFLQRCSHWCVALAPVKNLRQETPNSLAMQNRKVGKGGAGDLTKEGRMQGGERGGEDRMEYGWEWLRLIMQMYETQTMENKIITLLFHAPRYFIFLPVLEVSQALLHYGRVFLYLCDSSPPFECLRRPGLCSLSHFLTLPTVNTINFFFNCNWKKGKFEVNVDITLKGFCEVAKQHPPSTRWAWIAIQ